MKKTWKNFYLAAAVAVALGGSFLAPVASPASASVTKLYAYAYGRAFAPTSCPLTTTVSKECSLTVALAIAPSGSRVLLATPATTSPYYGNFTLPTSVTLAPAAGVVNPTLDGDATGVVDCPTTICNGPVVTVPATASSTPVVATLKALTIQDGDNTGGGGGGIEVGGTLDLEGVTIASSRGAPSLGEAGGIFVLSTGTLAAIGSTFSYDQGGIYNEGSVSITGSTFSKDAAGAEFYGGAIDNLNSMSIADSTFSSDTSGSAGQGDGGAIANSGTLSITGSTFSNDDAGSSGGAIENTEALSITGSTFSNDYAYTAVYYGSRGGGAIDSGGTLTVGSSTFSGNVATEGAAIYASEPFAVAESTFAGNAGDGTIYSDAGPDQWTTIVGSTFDGNSGIAALVDDDSGLIVAATILADQTTGNPDAPNAPCGTPPVDAGFNLEDDAAASCGFTAANHDLVGVDPELGPLQDNGGPTETMEPAADSPVLDQIPDATTLGSNPAQIESALCPIKDQRGVAAPAAKWGCAIGAVDLANTAEPLVTSVAPYYGPYYGGTTVTITGVNLTGATAVTFAGVPGTSLRVVSATKITVVAPVGTSQSIADVVVTAPGGSSPWRPGSQFIYD
jgi:hypothetical protein